MNRASSLIFPIAVAVVLMAVTAVVEGRWTERWAPVDSEIVDRWTEQLKHIPTEFGDWEAQDLEPSSEAEKQVAGFAGERQLAFKNRRTNEEVVMMLVCGQGRKVSKHTPDKCFVAAGFVLGEKIGSHTIRIGGISAEFYTSQFIKEDPERVQRLRIFWSWNDGSGWKAPSFPKATYAQSPALYKMYLISPIGHRSEDKPSTGAAHRFAREYIPLLDQALFPDKRGGQSNEVAQAAEEDSGE